MLGTNGIAHSASLAGIRSHETFRSGGPQHTRERHSDKPGLPRTGRCNRWGTRGVVSTDCRAPAAHCTSRVTARRLVESSRLQAIWASVSIDRGVAPASQICSRILVTGRQVANSPQSWSAASSPLTSSGDRSTDGGGNESSAAMLPRIRSVSSTRLPVRVAKNPRCSSSLPPRVALVPTKSTSSGRRPQRILAGVVAKVRFPQLERPDTSVPRQ